MGDSDLGPSAVCTVSSYCFESVPGHSNRNLPCLLLCLHVDAIISTFLKWNIYIGIWHSNAPSLTRLQLYVLSRNNKNIGLWEIHSFLLLRDTFPHRLSRQILPNEGIL
jgi:hypothetical protein